MTAANSAGRWPQAGSPGGGAGSLGGLAGRLARWLRSPLRGRACKRPRLALVERIALAPRQSLALVEAEGRRFLVATSAEGSPAFYALDEARASGRGAKRASW